MLTLLWLAGVPLGQAVPLALAGYLALALLIWERRR